MTGKPLGQTGYVDVNGLHLYYEVYGSGSPVVLLHGGMLTIELNYGGLIPTLAENHIVIGIEFQGHGRTADIDRELNPQNFASDVIGVLDHLGVQRAAIVGHSTGAATAIELAVSYGERVTAVVPISCSVRPDGLHEDLTDPDRMATSDRMPTAEDFAQFAAAYQQLSPHPDQFESFLEKMSHAEDSRGWSVKQLAGITCPVLVVVGDRDFTTIEHAALMQKLIPNAQLAVLPDTTHMQVTRRAEYLLPMLGAFLS